MSDDVNYRDINSQLRRPLRCQVYEDFVMVVYKIL